ncbi:MAG: efflux transporter outer membrane subunit [Cyclobacteriaceae bacterium]|nr:efflux transporter outer membrane subunit [Cyclobacteriaceae bacterium]
MKRIQKISFLSAAVLVILVVVSSCKVGPNFEKPDNPQPATFRFDSLEADTVVNLRWWELFGNPELDTLITIGLKENKDVLKAASRVEQARITVGFTKVDIYPSVGIAGAATVGNMVGGQPLNDAAGIYYGGLSLAWEIDFWGKIRRATEAAKANYVASEYGMRSVQISLISQIAQTYFQLLDFKRRLRISEQTVKVREEGLKIIQSRFDRGVVPEIDLNQAQIQLAIAKAAVPYYKRNVALTENALSVLLGRSPQEVQSTIDLVDQPYPPAIPAGIPSTLLERRPDILQAENILHAETANVGVAEALRYPSISLTGFGGVAASHQLSQAVSGDLAWSAGAGLVSPLLNWGKNKRRAEIQREVAQQALLNYEQQILIAFKEVDDALISVSTYQKEVEARELQVKAAVNARNLSQKRYDGGVTSYLEVLENDRSAFDAELQYSQARQQLINSYILLYKALGGGWITAEEEQQADSSGNE